MSYTSLTVTKCLRAGIAKWYMELNISFIIKETFIILFPLEFLASIVEFLLYLESLKCYSAPILTLNSFNLNKQPFSLHSIYKV